MKTINSRQVNEKKILELIDKKISKLLRRIIEQSGIQDDGEFKDPILPRK